ncbi:sugar phosphate isomerase/epimerase [Candidatus Bathyarchaeota archaeon]|nr:sugar phosphate isomerase/epimerase [Candidatus Bathyarchaeota archaeon]
MKLGLIVPLKEKPDEELKKVYMLGFPTCQVSCWDVNLYTSDVARLLKRAANNYGVEITAIWAGLPGKHIWNLIDGPNTIGLVPPETREIRLKALKKASNFTKEAGVENIITHVGFIPENPKDPIYISLIDVLKEIAEFCASNGQFFLFETGQETPITLLRTIEDIGMENLGVNFDPANLLMYGKANPVDALDILGRYVRGVHAKDGEYPTNGRELGREKPLGEGRVNFPALISKLKALGYSGAITIEREISGPQQIRDIIRAKELLEKLIQQI